MAFNFACFTLQRVVLPVVLVLAALCRPVGISFVYLLMFFVSPFVPFATKNNFKKSVSAYFIILITLSTILLVCHIALQVTIIALHIDSLFGTCSFTEQLLRHIGFIHFQNTNLLSKVEWLAPEVVVFITSLATYLVIKRIATGTVPQVENGEADMVRESLQNGNEAAVGSDDEGPAAMTTIARQSSKTEKYLPNFDGLIKISPLFCLATLLFAAILRPSVPGGFYYLIFLISGTYWATFKTLNGKFAVVLRLVMIVIVAHILCMVSYQTPWMQEHLSSTSLIARLIGLEPLVTSSCAKDIRVIVYETDFNADSYFSPFVMLFTYYVFALTATNLIKPVLMRSGTRKVDTAPGGNAPSNAGNDIPLSAIEQTPAEETFRTSILDHIAYGFTGIGGFIYQNSYIFTNVLMMTWSIVYHSWLTFVLLLWANVLWMIPNQRKAMMRSSPFVVFYAEFLVVAQYIYGMNLNNNELPSQTNITGINLKQIGFERPQENGVQPCVPLIVKTAFLLMFWVTLRQFFKEKKEKRRDSAIADIFAPLTVSVAGAGGYRDRDSKGSPMFLKRIGDIIKNLLVRLWIWLVVLVIFLCAMTGKNMTGFRICYMALFLFFLLVFQSSSTVWVKVMYGFWIFLIFYAMSILILIYTYQFDKFDQYWNDYLNISKTLQSDIGLERYKTKDLFLHLVSPTIIVILTVIQVHYFHKRFIDSLNQPPMSKRTEPEASPRRRTRSIFRHTDSDSGGFKQSFGELLAITFKRIRQKAEFLFRTSKDLFWRFLELHWIKFVYIAAFVCSASEVSLLHVVFVILVVLGVISNIRVRTFIIRVISFIVTLIVLAKMVYQITYLDHNAYNERCDNNNETNNNAVWFGLSKATMDTGLMGLIKKYIIYMVMATLQGVVTLRQYQMRRYTNALQEPAPKVLFPDVGREHAEVNLKGLIKYLFNYGYYKFGFEISLIALVSTITYRQDVVAVAYAFWLVILLLFKRRRCANIWGVFQTFILVSIILQYIVLVGLPPGLCIEYPWNDSPYSESIQRWAMLPGSLHYNHTPKLIFDFILLLFVNRQKRVFNIEKNPQRSANYPGGSNQSVVKDIKNLGVVEFENPTHDFLSHTRNYLDIFKFIVLCGFFWVTLAVVFLAGTNISDLLALGYLIGAFIFLWEGSDYYLRPIESIIYRWNWLIVYNVANIVVKTCLQMAGCMFMETLTKNCCWLVHILGINCASKSTTDFQTNDNSFNANDCPATAVQVVLLWDTICFAFLIFQLRIFKSHYFCHIIMDTKANNILASRGAEIIESLRQKQVERRLEHENDVLKKIKRKMEKIRATQQKMLRPFEKATHFDEHGNPVPGSRPHKRKEIQLHPQAVRAGDYYMFEDVDDKFELDVIDDANDYLDIDRDNITESELKMKRRKTFYDETAKSRDRDDVDMPSTSKEAPTRVQSAESKPRTEPDSGDLTEKDSDADFNANPIVRLLEGFLVSLTIRLNRFSRNYRYVNKILFEEKKALKEVNETYLHKTRPHLKNTAAFVQLIKKNMESENESEVDSAHPAPNIINIPQDSTDITDPFTTMQSHDQPPPLSQPPPPPQQQQQDQSPSQSLQQSPDPYDDIIETPSVDDVDASKPTESAEIGPRGTIYAVEDYDFTSRDHNIIIEVLISAWYAILSNTDLICYIVVFINQVVNASLISLPLPIMVFLWGTLSLPRPTKTFWVTLIAYTQAIVLIKCIFQFKLIWRNYNMYNFPEHPLELENIVGVEMDPHYATYDLILLFVLFFHRFILKSHGLWKSDQFKSVVTENEQSSVDGNERQADGAEEAHEEPEQEDIKSTVSTSKESSRSGIRKFKHNSYTSALTKFFHNLVHKARLPTDVYALMFFCDFINFFVLLFGFTAFSSKHTEGGGVKTYLAENKVPVPFLIMLLVQFILIVIDRALYLRKALVYKIIFHFISVFGVHIWMFFIVPAVTERSFSSSAPPVIFYIIKCFYMLLSSYQIKCGYPMRILGNFLTRSFSMVNMISFKVYMLTPFLYELRTILDWLCTDTTMTLFDWLKMEDIFANIYFIKCTRQMETDFPAIRAQKKATYMKLIMGGSAILLIAIAIWGPLALFALFNAVGQSNVPTEVSVSLRIGSYDPIYSATSRESTIVFNEKMYADMKNVYMKDPNALSFLQNYDPSDIAAIKLSGNSPSMWNIAPPDKERLLNDLRNNITLVVRFSYEITRVPPTKGTTGKVGAEIIYRLNETYPYRQEMIMMLEGNKTIKSVVLPHIVPKFIKVLNSGDPSYVPTLLIEADNNYHNLVLEMHTSSNVQWWEITDYCGDDDPGVATLTKLPLFDCTSGVVFYTFNDKKFPATLTFLTAGGIIGLYTTFVLVVSRVLKSFLSGQTRRIMYEDLPYVDRVLQLCLDIYLVREALEFVLEEDLFAKLIFLYRSPETMIKWTRPKEEVGDDEADTDSVRSRVSGRRQEHQ